MTGYLVLTENFFTSRLLMPVRTIVRGIRNSTQRVEILSNLNALKASVREWPIVKAVIKINNCFQSENW